MPRSCCISICRNRPSRIYIEGPWLGQPVRFYKFPKDTIMMNAWLSKCPGINLAESSKSTICSIHFKPEDYEDLIRAQFTGEHPKRLKHDAIPSLLLPGMKSSSACKLQKKALKKRSNKTAEDGKHGKRNRLEDELASCNSNSPTVKDEETKIGDDDIEIDIDLPKKEDMDQSDTEASRSSSSTLEEFEDSHEVYSVCCSVCDTTSLDRYRYFCASCTGQALCGECVVGGAHGSCYVLRAPSHSPQAEITAVLQAIRKEFTEGDLSKESDEPPVEIKSELKQECAEDPLAETTETPRALNTAATVTIDKILNNILCI